MKKYLLMIVLMLTAVGAYSQKQVYYRSTGDNVNIRKGPGKNYSVMSLNGGAHCGAGKAQLYKGDIVVSNGRQRNGFIYVAPAGEPCWEDGWVSAQFLTRASKCAACNGRGNTGRICPACNGSGVYVCCRYTGMELCERCWGIGYR